MLCPISGLYCPSTNGLQLSCASALRALQSVHSGRLAVRHQASLLRIARFRPILTEVLLIDRQPENGAYEPLIDYIPLEQAQAVVDMVGHRLVKANRVDLK